MLNLTVIPEKAGIAKAATFRVTLTIATALVVGSVKETSLVLFFAKLSEVAAIACAAIAGIAGTIAVTRCGLGSTFGLGFFFTVVP